MTTKAKSTAAVSMQLARKGVLKLDTLAHVRAEMSRLYGLWTRGIIEGDAMTKGVYALKEIRGCIEGELLADIQARLVKLTEGSAHG